MAFSGNVSVLGGEGGEGRGERGGGTASLSFTYMCMYILWVELQLLQCTQEEVSRWFANHHGLHTSCILQE